MFGGFAVVPFLSPFLVSNVGVTNEQLPLVYIAGGFLSLVGSLWIGRMADRYGKLRVYQIVAPINAAMLFLVTCLPPVPLAIAVLATAMVMVTNAGRMVPAMALITSSVEPYRRGGFLGANSAVQHIAAGLGTSFAGLILTENGAGELQHYHLVGLLAAAVTVLSVWLAARVQIVDSAPIPLVESIAAAEVAVDAG